jgi:hypothetical protein
MRKEWWNVNSFFDSDECLDWRIAMKAFPKSSVLYIPENLYFYRKHPYQKTANFRVSHQSMNIVYQEWLTLLNFVGLNSYSYESFAALGVPWLTDYEIDFEDFISAAKAVNDYSILISSSMAKSVRYLLKRRFIFAIRNTSTLTKKSKLLNLGLTQIPGIIFDSILK